MGCVFYYLFNRKFGTFDNPPPSGGSGFTTSRDGNIVPEYSIPRGEAALKPPLDGAELIKVENGVEILIGGFDGKQFIKP